MTIAISADRPSNRCALFDYGFRPFFLLSGCYALAIVPIWLYRFAHAATPFGALPAMYWHSHEMLYGFVMAAVAGFLLTARTELDRHAGLRRTASDDRREPVDARQDCDEHRGAVPFWVTALPSSVCCRRCSCYWRRRFFAAPIAMRRCWPW